MNYKPRKRPAETTSTVGKLSIIAPLRLAMLACPVVNSQNYIPEKKLH